MIKDKPHRRKRRIPYGLLFVLPIVFVGSVIAGYFAWDRAKERLAVERLIQVGAIPPDAYEGVIAALDARKLIYAPVSARHLDNVFNRVETLIVGSQGMPPLRREPFHVLRTIDVRGLRGDERLANVLTAVRACVTHVSLKECDVGAQSILALEGCSKLEVLHIEGCRIGRQGPNWAKLSALRSLTLSEISLSDALLDGLDDCHLVRLDLARSKVSKANSLGRLIGTLPLSDFAAAGSDISATQLQVLLTSDISNIDVSDTRVSDEMFRSLRLSNDMFSLNVAGSSCSTFCLIAALNSRVKLLNMSRTRVDDRCWPTSANKTIVSLDMAETAITDASIPRLFELKLLNHLDVSGTLISPAGVDRLQTRGIFVSN